MALNKCELVPLPFSNLQEYDHFLVLVSETKVLEFGKKEVVVEIMRLSIISPTTLRGRGGDMSGFVLLLLMNFGPRGGAFEIC